MRRLPAAGVLLGVLASSTLSSAGSIDDAVRGVDRGEVRFIYAVRPDVRGDGKSITIVGNDTVISWDKDCDDRDFEPGPARVALQVRKGEVKSLEVRVGGKALRGDEDVAVDLGEVTPEVASAYFLDLVREADESVAEAAVFPASIALDVTVWPKLIEVARNDKRPEEVRTTALFWVGQEAAEEATRGLETVLEDDDEDMEVREAAVFALSQRPSEEAVPSLTHVVKTTQHPRLRKTALFWLAQHDDPRVIDLFEEILLENH